MKERQLWQYNHSRLTSRTMCWTICGERIADTRWPDEIPNSDWDYGSNMAYVRELADYWLNEYDWRKHEAMLNGFTQFRADVEGMGIHYIHERGKGPNPIPLVITHGWPSTFFEMHKIIPMLSDPAAHGGDAADASMSLRRPCRATASPTARPSADGACRASAICGSA